MVWQGRAGRGRTRPRPNAFCAALQSSSYQLFPCVLHAKPNQKAVAQVMMLVPANEVWYQSIAEQDAKDKKTLQGNALPTVQRAEQTLKGKVLPSVVKEQKPTGEPPFRVGSSLCSTSWCRAVGFNCKQGKQMSRRWCIHCTYQETAMSKWRRRRGGGEALGHKTTMMDAFTQKCRIA